MIPLKGYGGHERLVEMFAKEYNRLGHNVHLLITSGSVVEGCTVHDFGKEGFPPKKSDANAALPTAWLFLWKHRNNYDLIHNFGRLAYLLPILRHPVKKIMTYGREISSNNILLINSLGSRNLRFTACSGNLLSRVTAGGRWDIVYNAIQFKNYKLTANLDVHAPLIFLGRIEKIKGCHTAIKIALATGNKLIIAGNISPLKEEQAYFDAEIKPFIDGDRIKYIGEVNDVQKSFWLGSAKALLFPIEWNEPFGIVMIEAMACGTPVIAFKKGSVDEVIDEGTTGFKVNSFDEMLAAANKIDTISRKQCRDHAAKRFDVSIVAQEYLNAISKHRKKIVIVTTGQPAANPRVMKEYEALKQDGHDVIVLYTYSAAWSHAIDEKKFLSAKLKRQDFVEVGGNPFNEKLTYFFSRLVFKILALISKFVPIFTLKKLSLVRSAFGLWINTKRYVADIYIAHYLGALPAAIKAGRIHRAKVIFDAEDFHRGEEPYYNGQIEDVIQLENKLFPKVDLITTASPLISKRYKELYPLKNVVTINNVFSKRFLQPIEKNGDGPLKLFWFSQNIGPKRGLEIIIDAVNLIEEEFTLTLLGNVRDENYLSFLLSRTSHPEKIKVVHPISPEEVFEFSAHYDVGLAAEVPLGENRNICLTNKIFTYLMAGNCIVASNTAAQKDFVTTYPNVGFMYKYDDHKELSSIIKSLINDRDKLENCKFNANKLANEMLNWEVESLEFLKQINLLETV